MKASASKRLCAYFIDAIIVSIIFNCIVMLVPTNRNITVLQSELTTLNEEYLKEDMAIEVYTNRYASIISSLDKENVLVAIIDILVLLGYFVLVPYYWDGKTIGMKLFKIRIKKEKEKLSLNDLIIRCLIINGIGCSMISLCFVYILPDYPYFVLSTILGIIQLLLVIISGFMVIYRHDKRGIHDLVSGTGVVIEG